MIASRAPFRLATRGNPAADFAALAVVATGIERLATEIRHLQRTEVLEAEEYFSQGQKGSSAMPHKRNPVTCERVAGLARVLRGNAQAALENVALWHERDITHSSVERIIIPDSCILLDNMLTTMTDVVDKLLVYPERMKQNLDLTCGLIFSQSVLLALTKKGMRREDAYAAVQGEAMRVWQERTDFKGVLLKNPAITAVLSKEELDAIFDIKKSIRHVDTIFQRLGLA